MRPWLRVGLVVVALGGVGIASAQDSLVQRDGQGPVMVAVTLAAPPAVGASIRARVVLDTHSVTLDGVVFDQAVVLRTPDGAEVAPTGVEEAKGSGHHREAVVVFSPVTQPGTVRIAVKNVGGVAERSFKWELRAAR